jgi:nucleoid-associated protein YgaU
VDLAASAAGAVAGFLKPGKAKLVRVDATSGPDADIDAILAATAPYPAPVSKEDTELTFMFNPTTYKLSQSVEISPKPDKWIAGGEIEYLHTGPLTLSMQLFFDDFASARGDVTPKISKLLEWQLPTSDKNGDKPPPLVKFVWGNKQLDTFTGVIKTVDCSYTVFRRDGTPLQAKVDLTIVGKRLLPPGANPTSHAVDMRRVHTVVQGETIHTVAYLELGQPAYWRAIAEANGIDDPLRVKPGQALLIPTAADAARRA